MQRYYFYFEITTYQTEIISITILSPWILRKDDDEKVDKDLEVKKKSLSLQQNNKNR